MDAAIKKIEAERRAAGKGPKGANDEWTAGQMAGISADARQKVQPLEEQIMADVAAQNAKDVQAMMTNA
jgi:hypothetical protein